MITIIKFSDRLKSSFDAGVPDEDRLMEIARAGGGTGRKRISRPGALIAACLALFVAAGAIWAASGTLPGFEKKRVYGPSSQAAPGSEIFNEAASDRKEAPLDVSGDSPDPERAPSREEASLKIRAGTDDLEKNESGCSDDRLRGDPVQSSAELAETARRASDGSEGTEISDGPCILTKDDIPDTALSFMIGAGRYLAFFRGSELVIADAPDLSVAESVNTREVGAGSAGEELGVVLVDCAVSPEGVLVVCALRLTLISGELTEELSGVLFEADPSGLSAYEPLALWKKLCDEYSGLKTERLDFTFDIGGFRNIKFLSCVVSDVSL